MNYAELPDDMPSSELKELFTRYVEEHRGSRLELSNLEELLELADRQWHTYSLLDSEVKANIEEMLIPSVDFRSKEKMGYMLTITSMLGLENVYRFMIRNQDQITDQRVRSTLEGQYYPYQEYVLDPYYGMKGFLKEKS